MLERLDFRRPDGTFVGTVNGLPYHVIDGDPYWLQAKLIADEMGSKLRMESPPISQPAQPTVPQDVSFWQFMMAAWQLNFITHEEALAAVKSRTMPPAFAAAIADLPEPAKQAAELKFAGITRMLRSDPLFALVVAANRATPAQIDGVFTAAASIE